MKKNRDRGTDRSGRNGLFWFLSRCGSIESRTSPHTHTLLPFGRHYIPKVGLRLGHKRNKQTRHKAKGQRGWKHMDECVGHDDGEGRQTGRKEGEGEG